jgi:hypothetical protein
VQEHLKNIKPLRRARAHPTVAAIVVSMSEARRVFSPSATALPTPSPASVLGQATPGQAMLVAFVQWVQWLWHTYGGPIGCGIAQLIVVLLLARLLVHIYSRLAERK